MWKQKAYDFPLRVVLVSLAKSGCRPNDALSSAIHSVPIRCVARGERTSRWTLRRKAAPARPPKPTCTATAERLHDAIGVEHFNDDASLWVDVEERITAWAVGGGYRGHHASRVGQVVRFSPSEGRNRTPRGAWTGHPCLAFARHHRKIPTTKKVSVKLLLSLQPSASGNSNTALAQCSSGHNPVAATQAVVLRP
jgi:hypothetical protein